MSMSDTFHLKTIFCRALIMDFGYIKPFRLEMVVGSFSYSYVFF